MKVNKEKYRRFLKSVYWSEEFQDLTSDQKKGVPYPDLQKPYSKDDELIELSDPEILTSKYGNQSLLSIINQRQSRRRYTNEELSLEELTYLVWVTQGVKKVIRDGYCTKRTVPSAGARHPFELYLVVKQVDKLDPGIYRYLPLEHKLLAVDLTTKNLSDKITEGCHDQKFVGDAAVVFIWSVIPYRTEWRYTPVPSKIIALDAGHACQNLYLAAESIGAGTVAIGAYDQAKMDDLLGLDGKDEFVIYIAPVGKVRDQLEKSK